MVEVVGMPSSCAAVIISTQRATGSLLGLSSRRTRSSKISAAVPGVLTGPLLFIIWGISGRRIPAVFAAQEISRGGEERPALGGEECLQAAAMLQEGER